MDDELTVVTRATRWHRLCSIAWVLLWRLALALHASWTSYVARTVRRFGLMAPCAWLAHAFLVWVLLVGVPGLAYCVLRFAAALLLS